MSDEEGGDRALSVILTTMLSFSALASCLGEIFAPQYVWLFFEGYRRDLVGAALCTSLTRLICPRSSSFLSAAS